MYSRSFGITGTTGAAVGILAMIIFVTAAPFCTAEESRSEQSINVTAMAGAAGLTDETLPLVGTEVGYRHRNAFGRGHLFDAAVGIAYGRLGYTIGTPIGAIGLTAAAAPVPAEYEVVEDGEERTLATEAPAYQTTLRYFLATERLVANVSSQATWQPWTSTDADVIAPDDVVALEQGARGAYRLRQEAWTTNVLAPTAGWRIDAGYRNVYRPGYGDWGPRDNLVTHDSAPQHTLEGGFSTLTSLGRRSPWAALGLDAHWSRSLNAYDRDLPRFGQPGECGGIGVSGYAPGSLPSSRASLVTASFIATLGDSVLARLRYDWFHDHSDGEEERRGVGFGLAIVPTDLSRLDVSVGVAMDPAKGTELPVAGSLTWIQEVEL